MDWDTARGVCTSRGSGWDLASIGSAGENDFVKTNVSAADTWIGFSDETQENAWTWSNLDAVTYTSWEATEPNNAGDEDCVRFDRTSSRWADAVVFGLVRFAVRKACNAGRRLQFRRNPQRRALLLPRDQQRELRERGHAVREPRHRLESGRYLELDRKLVRPVDGRVLERHLDRVQRPDHRRHLRLGQRRGGHVHQLVHAARQLRRPGLHRVQRYHEPVGRLYLQHAAARGVRGSAESAGSRLRCGRGLVRRPLLLRQLQHSAVRQRGNHLHRARHRLAPGRRHQRRRQQLHSDPDQRRHQLLDRPGRHHDRGQLPLENHRKRADLHQLGRRAERRGRRERGLRALRPNDRQVVRRALRQHLRLGVRARSGRELRDRFAGQRPLLLGEHQLPAAGPMPKTIAPATAPAGS